MDLLPRAILQACKDDDANAIMLALQIERRTTRNHIDSELTALPARQIQLEESLADIDGNRIVKHPRTG